MMIKLTRYTSTGKFYPEIDGLRFFAILPVVLAHAAAVYNENVSDLSSVMNSSYDWLFKGGDLGVQLFFVISGYILGSGFYRAALANTKPNLRKYYFRRLTRLEPPYIIAMTVFFITSIYLGRFGFLDGIGNYIASLFYVHNIVYQDSSIINTVAWTLEIELQFYVFAPLLYYIYRLSFAWSVGIFLAMIGLFLCSSYVFDQFYFTIFSHGHFFAIGALFHLIGDFRKRLCFSSDNLNLAVFVTVLIIFYTFDFDYSNVQGNLLKLLCFMVLFSLTLESQLVKRMLSMSALYIIGGMCYSIYLLHYPLLSFISKICGKMAFDSSFAIFLVAAVIIVLVVSSIFFILFERPFMNPKIFSNLAKRLSKNK